ncbi:MAG TPA: ATP-binding cassette domain-containing protein, partial [Terracidiphilus sp.]|nr:ATP-binding cassette domain-containing protein [Terracidiphilus sp.]
MLDPSSIPEFPEAFVEATAPLEGQSATTAGAPFISFSHVNISFDGRLVLEDVSFSVERGQTLCILGRSGVGKSVALRLLMGFLKPDSG